MTEFDKYIVHGEPRQKEMADTWQTAIGPQDVDGLKVSPYLLDTARQHIEGDIFIDRHSKLLILKYPDRIVFSNPGIMLVSKAQYFSGGESICRNPALQTMFSMIGAVEKAGSGADTIVQGWDDAKFGTPIISEKSEPNKVELTLPIISDGDSNGTSNGTSNGASNGTSIGLKELRELISNKKKVPYQVTSKVIVELCQDWIETKELADKTGLSVSHIKGKIIPRMIADGLLEPYDKQSRKSPGQKYRAVPK